MTLQETIAAAESPKTCSQTLLSLYRDLRHVPEWRRSKIRKKIVGNPNICATLAREISFWHGRELFKNPVLPLLLLEDPNLFKHVNFTNLCRLLSWEETPSFLLHVLAQHPHELIRHEAKYHVGLHGDYEDDSWIDEVKDVLVKSVRASRNDEWTQWWHSCSAFPHWLSKRLRWAAVPRTIKTRRIFPTVTEPEPTADEAMRLNELSEEELISLAIQPGQHPDRLRLILELDSKPYPHSYWRIRQAAGQHPNVPQDLVCSGQVQTLINYCDRTTLEVLLDKAFGYNLESRTKLLLAHEDADDALCRKALVRTAANCANILTSAPAPLIFLGLLHADNAERLRYWEPHIQWHERLAAALHPNTDPDIRACIAMDSHRWVRAAARAAQADPTIWKRFWE